SARRPAGAGRVRKLVHSDAQAILSQLLRDLRLDAGLWQVDLARKLGKPQSFVAKYERGDRRLDVLEFIEVSQALDADPAWVFGALMTEIAVHRRIFGKS